MAQGEAAPRRHWPKRIVRLGLVGLATLAIIFGAAALVLPRNFDPRCSRANQLEASLPRLFREAPTDEVVEACRELVRCEPEDPFVRYDLACALVRDGRKEEGLAVLSETVAMGYDEPDWLAQDEDFASVRAEARFTALLEQTRRNLQEGAGSRDGAAVELPGVRTVEGFVPGGFRYRLRRPPDASPEKRAPLIVWMHPSYGFANDFVEPLAPAFAERGFALLVVTQKHLRSWRDEEAERLFDVTLPVVAAAEPIVAARPVLFGFSAGGQMALMLWRKDPGRFGGLILDAAYPLEEDEAGQQWAWDPPQGPSVRRTPLLVLVGQKDHGASVWASLEQDWRAAGVPLTIEIVAGAGHEWLVGDEERRVVLDWLTAQVKTLGASTDAVE